MIEAVVPMHPNCKVEVTVRDGENNPIPNAVVSFSPNQTWFKGGSEGAGREGNFLAGTRAQLASRDHKIAALPHPDAAPSYSAKTDAHGSRVNHRFLSVMIWLCSPT